MNSVPKISPSPKDCRFVDTHCHLDMEAFAEDLEEVLERAVIAGVERIVTIGIDLPSSGKAITLAQRYPQISAAIGVHPHDVGGLSDKDYASLEKLCADHRRWVVGYGEIGLDYYRNYSEPALQRKHFARQLDLAYDLKLPVIIHNRNADDDTLDILRQAKPLEYGGIMHCFSGNLSFAHKVLDLGMMISIPGVVTFKNSQTLQEVAGSIPLASLLIETDGPFLAPHPFRGKRNEPSYAVHTARKIAELRGTDMTVIAAQTTANAEKLFDFTRK